jgi:hypothetical protein
MPKRGKEGTSAIGRSVVADPDICRGRPTFRGTRILVADVLEQVAAGTAWENIVGEWRARFQQMPLRKRSESPVKLFVIMQLNTR